MRKFSIGIVVGLLIGLLAFATFAVADNPVKLIINGQTIDCQDSQPQIINGRTYVPARYVAEPLGAKVVWDAVNNAVIITRNGTASAPTQTTSFTMPQTVTQSTTMTIDNGEVTSTAIVPVTTVNADGSKTTINADGSKTVVSRDGAETTTIQPNGGKTWEGTFRSEEAPDSSIKLIPDPDGKIKAGGGGSGPAKTTTPTTTTVIINPSNSID